jgi:multidrug transporter EmrE-like cation transporter
MGVTAGTATVALMVATIVLTAFSQVVLKVGMSGESVQRVLMDGAPALHLSWVIGTSPLVLLGLASYTVSALLWLFVLSRVDVSVAYPCMALGYVVTFAAGVLILGEPFSWPKLVGVVVIIIGVAAVASSS